MRIAIISTRGIPNYYGGFEMFAEQLSVRLVARGHDVIVYSPHYHLWKGNEYKGVRIKHIHSLESWLGRSVGSFFYDFLSLRDALQRENLDIIYIMGYTSIVPAYIWYNVKNIKTPVIVTNMDGLEYKRMKYDRLTRLFLCWEERMTVKYSRFLITDNVRIWDYYKSKYGIESTLLAYGADIPDTYNECYLSRLCLTPNGYFLLIARIEPENNVAMVIEGYLKSQWCCCKPLVIIGNRSTRHAKKLIAKYRKETAVRFIGGIYDINKLNALRHFSYAYFHGHSVGGTNPSLLEAMACGCFIISHDNIFNRAVLGRNALYFANERDIVSVLNSIDSTVAKKDEFINNNVENICNKYSWDELIVAYEKFFYSIINFS